MNSIIDEKLAAVVEMLRTAGAREIYLFGSVARSSAGVDSDLDLAVVGLPPDRFYELVGKTAALLGRDVDLVDLATDTPFTRYLKAEGELKRVA